MNRISQPSPAIVVAVLALVAALAGTAVAGPDASTSAINKKKVKKIAKKQATKQINKLAPGLSVAKAVNADTANNANNLGSSPPTAYASSSSEAYHKVGATGEPAFGNGWSNFGGTFSTAAFYKDSLGVVHLKGMLAGSADPSLAATAFTLPQGYRPAKDLFVGVASSGASKSMFIRSSGAVQPQDPPGNDIGIDGLSFRAGS